MHVLSYEMPGEKERSAPEIVGFVKTGKINESCRRLLSDRISGLYNDNIVFLIFLKLRIKCFSLHNLAIPSLKNLYSK